MTSPPPSPVPAPSQETFERVFSLQRRVDPDHENHITSSFSVLNINGGKNTTAKPDPVYKGNMTCFSLAGSNLDHNLALSPTIPQENYPPARDSLVILNDSGVRNHLPGNSSTPKPPSSVYSHSLLQPIYVPVIRESETGGLITNRRTDIRKGGTWHE